MLFFDNLKNVKEYIDESSHYNGKFLCDILDTKLKQNSTILELGMGAGKDLKILGENYNVTGSDNSQIFLDIYLRENPKENLLKLDAVTLDTNQRFDCIYSNKVLQHLSLTDLKQSIISQYNILNTNGLIFHAFWRGSGEEFYDNLLFRYYLEEELISLFDNYFSIIEIANYAEMEANDSIYILAKKLEK